jgi:hypothetical protein
MARINRGDALLAAGRTDEAKAVLVPLVADLRHSRQAYLLASASINLMSVQVALGDTEAARALTAEFGTVWSTTNRLRFMADHLALLAALEGRPRAAARLLGWSQQSYESTKLLLQSNEVKAAAQARSLAATVLGAEQFGQHVAEGRTLTHEDVISAALAAAD